MVDVRFLIDGMGLLGMLLPVAEASANPATIVPPRSNQGRSIRESQPCAA